MPIDRQTYDFAHRLADEASAITLAGFRGAGKVINKSANGYSPQTPADRGAERAMRAMIEESFPDDGIEGEEEEAKKSKSGRRWILDPIDGTAYYAAGAQGWGTLIGLYQGEKPLFGLADHPAIGERYYGDSEQAWCGEKLIHTRPTENLGEALFATTTPDLFQNAAEKAALAALAQTSRFALYGGNCHHYCLLAAGRIDSVAETRLKPCDILPLVPIIEGAGGMITDWQGAPIVAGGQALASATPALHAKVLECLNR